MTEPASLHRADQVGEEARHDVLPISMCTQGVGEGFAIVRRHAGSRALTGRYRQPIRLHRKRPIAQSISRGVAGKMGDGDDADANTPENQETKRPSHSYETQ